MAHFGYKWYRWQRVIHFKLFGGVCGAVGKIYSWILRACEIARTWRLILCRLKVQIFEFLEMKVFKKWRVRFVENERVRLWKNSFKKCLHIGLNNTLCIFIVAVKWRQLLFDFFFSFINCLDLFVSEFYPLNFFDWIIFMIW